MAEMHPSTGAIKKKIKKGKSSPKPLPTVKRALANLSPENKMQALMDKYAQLFDDFQEVTEVCKGTQKEAMHHQRENDKLRLELSRAFSKIHHLETLARELHRQNKVIREDTTRTVREEERKHKLSADKFLDNINALTTLMNEDRDKSTQLKQENADMTQKISRLCNQFEEHESSLAKMSKQIDLEKKLAEARIMRIEEEFATEKQKWQEERDMYLTSLRNSEDTISHLRIDIDTLQTYIKNYTDQCNELDNTMARSRKVIEEYQNEMKRRHKDQTNVEKDRNMWRTKCSVSEQSNMYLLTVNNQLQQEITGFAKKLETMGNLCRKLQQERMAYIQQLKNAGMDPITPEGNVQTAASETPSFSFEAYAELLHSPLQDSEKYVTSGKLLNDIKREFHSLALYILNEVKGSHPVPDVLALCTALDIGSRRLNSEIFYGGPLVDGKFTPFQARLVPGGSVEAPKVPCPPAPATSPEPTSSTTEDEESAAVREMMQSCVVDDFPTENGVDDNGEPSDTAHL